ncbi:MAG TPA: DUF2071 domain-containing protein [Fimbriiglobus sp.]|nr:DUF2071 domain-containing protein [Fimbriiglobus sp.]
MRIPVIRGVIDRRVLANYRVEPDVLARLLPVPFRPKLIRGQAVAGICLIRLRNVRPRSLPAWLGISSENAAHRAAVEWDEGGAVREGVYIWRRDTGSRLNALAGGRLFPGVHHHASFDVEEAGDTLRVALRSDDGVTAVSVAGRVSDRLPASSVFGSVAEASAFFAAGSVGYSPAADPARLNGLELRYRGWRVEPMEVAEVRSSFFDDRARFPPSSVAFDCALVMRGIEHEWHGLPDLCCGAGQGAIAATPTAS